MKSGRETEAGGGREEGGRAVDASQHWDRLGPGYRSANLYKLLGWGGYKSRAAGPPSRSKREA